MDLRTQTSLFCGVLALAIAVSIVLRRRARRPQFLFAAFAADMGLWYLAQWLYLFRNEEVWVRFTAALAVLLPQLAVWLFEAMLPQVQRRSTLQSVGGALMVPMIVIVLSPWHAHPAVRLVVFLYVFGMLLAGLTSLAVRGEKSGSRATQRRIRFLVAIGALAATFSLADFLWFVGAPLPPVGAVLSIVFLFALSESMIRDRLVDVYEVVGQLLVSTALAFGLAGLFYVFVVLFGGFGTTYLGAILAAIVILVLLEPLREKVETYTLRAFFRERADIERAVATARQDLVHVLRVEDMARVVISALEQSLRATGAAVYLRDSVGHRFDLIASFGPSAPPHLDAATARPLLDKLSERSSLFLEQLPYDTAEARRRGRTREAEANERVTAAAQLLGPHRVALTVGISGEKEIFGLLLLVDDRVRDAYSDDEAALLETLGLQMGVVVENSRSYQRMRERDRLAALGQMAAGLAHEVKNPLGAIKGAAQLLNEPSLGTAAREFVEIILEEVERLDRVVGSVLSYARPHSGSIGPVDVNAIVSRTLRLLSADRDDQCELLTELGANLPPVKADPERLRQVVINLVRNAIQAMDGAGRVKVSTQLQRRSEETQRRWVSVAVQDNGPGITRELQQSLFVPFFTTKEKGTGLGLAISQRMVQDMGGRIEVSSQPGSGATFSVFLAAADSASTSQLETLPALPKGE